MLLKDENVNVVKKAILTMTQLYKVALQVRGHLATPCHTWTHLATPGHTWGGPSTKTREFLLQTRGKIQFFFFFFVKFGGSGMGD